MSIRVFGKIQTYSKSHYQQRILLIAQQKLNKHRNNSNSNNNNSNENNINVPENLTNGSRIGQTTILVQQGCDIQELPVILRKMQSDEIAVICPNVAQSHKIQAHLQKHQLNSINESEILPDLVIQQLDYCVTSIGILSIIDQIPEDKLTAEIAAHAFDRLIRNETLISLKNLEHSSPVFEKLIRCILKNCDPKVLLDFMEILKTFLDLQKTVQRFCDELLLRNSDGMLNCIEICECIERFADCKQYDGAEKFWTGIADQEKSIDANNIKFIFKILPKLKISKRLVYGVLERQTPKVWWNLKVPALIESIEALVQANCAPVRTMQSFARWLNTNIHAVNEFQLETVVRSITKLDYSNSEIEKALERRVIKSAEEIEVLRYVAKVSSDAHKQVMKMMKPGMTEYQGESEFLHHSYSVGGCRVASYTCICGTGLNAATLHYGHAGAPNDKIVKDGDLCLFDMGANYAGYCADITCTFPANGKFTADQKLIYNAVLAANLAIINNAKDGVSWKDMHLLANKVMLEKLKDGNLLRGDVDDMLKAGLGAIFQPHGLGHLLGLDVHDVGGYLPGQPERPTEPGVKSLRFARILKDGMYVTIEPGCYFIDCLMDKALKDEILSKFINREVFERFRDFGGVRIEDDVLIKKDSCENFAIVPRTVEEIEKWMSS